MEMALKQDLRAQLSTEAQEYISKKLVLFFLFLELFVREQGGMSTKSALPSPLIVLCNCIVYT